MRREETVRAEFRRQLEHKLGVALWVSDRRAGARPTHAGAVFVSRVGVRGKRRYGRRDQYSQGGTRPLRL